MVITILFILSKNGWLRKWLIFFFACLSWSSVARGLAISGRDVPNEFIGFPFALGSFLLMLYLIITFKNK